MIDETVEEMSATLATLRPITPTEGEKDTVPVKKAVKKVLVKKPLKVIPLKPNAKLRKLSTLLAKPRAKKAEGAPALKPISKVVANCAAIKKLNWKLRAARVPGLCSKLGCQVKFPSRGQIYCKAHKKAVRKVQLKLNNIVWRRRVKAGTAGHHVVYDDTATKWTMKARKEAEKKVKTNHSIVKTLKVLNTIIAKTRKAA